MAGTQWATPEMNADIVRMRGEGVSYGVITKALNNSYGLRLTKDQTMGRGKRLNLTDAAAAVVRRGVPPDPTPVDILPDWPTDAALELLLKDRARGCTARQMAERWGVKINAVDYRTLQHGVSVSGRAIQQKRARDRQPSPPLTRGPVQAPRPELYVERHLGRADGRRPAVLHGIGYWNEVKACPGPVFAPGQCHWALRCDASAVGNWCSEHAKMIGRRAG